MPGAPSWSPHAALREGQPGLLQVWLRLLLLEFPFLLVPKLEPGKFKVRVRLKHFIVPESKKVNQHLKRGGEKRVSRDNEGHTQKREKTHLTAYIRTVTQNEIIKLLGEKKSRLTLHETKVS